MGRNHPSRSSGTNTESDIGRGSSERLHNLAGDGVVDDLVDRVEFRILVHSSPDAFRDFAAKPERYRFEVAQLLRLAGGCIVEVRVDDAFRVFAWGSLLCEDDHVELRKGLVPAKLDSNQAVGLQAVQADVVLAQLVGPLSPWSVDDTAPLYAVRSISPVPNFVTSWLGRSSMEH